MRYERDEEIQTNVWNTIKVNQAKVNKILNVYNRDEELLCDCECYDNETHLHI